MRKYAILCVDDEENILSALERVFMEEDDYEVITALNGEKGLEILKERPVDLIISDQRMPGMSGTEFLKEARKHCPDTIRIVLSGFSDFDTVTGAINEGEIYRLIQKPWEDEQLLSSVKDSLEKYDLIRENKNLQEEVNKQNENLKELNIKLEEKVEERTKELLIRNQTLLLSQEMLENISTPIMGIGRDEMIVFMNKKAQEIYRNNEFSLIGKDIKEVLPEILVNMIKKVFETNQVKTVNDFKYNNNCLTIKCLTLHGTFAGKGVILEMIVNEEKG